MQLQRPENEPDVQLRQGGIQASALEANPCEGSERQLRCEQAAMRPPARQKQHKQEE